MSDGIFSEECGGPLGVRSPTDNADADGDTDKKQPAVKRKSDGEGDKVYTKRRCSEPAERVVVCTEALEKSVEGKDQEVELLAHDSWSEEIASDDSTRTVEPPLKSLLKKRLMMKSMESGASKAENVATERKIEMDSSENRTTSEEKPQEGKEAKRKGKRVPKKDAESNEPAKRSKRLNSRRQNTLTDSTGTSEVDSSENLASTFDRLHDSTTMQDQTGKGRTGLSPLLVPYRKKPATRGKASNSGFRASGTEGVMMMGNETMAAAHLTDSMSEVEETNAARPSEAKKVGRRSRHFTEALLHKSLSEECEDLGVDRPSTSELFPEADLLLDTNSSPCFDTAPQDASCSRSVVEPIFTEFSLPPNFYSSTSEEGNSNESKPKTGAKPDKIGTRSVRAGPNAKKKSYIDVELRPSARRVSKTGQSKKAKPDINGGSEPSGGPINRGAQDPGKDTIVDPVNGSSLSTEADGNATRKSSLPAYKDSKPSMECRPTVARLAKCVTDNEYSNTDASPGESTFGTESSSEDGTLMSNRYITNRVDCSESAASPPPEYDPSCPRTHAYGNRVARRRYGNKRHRPPSAQEFRDHNVDSGETWESTSSQDKAGADDEDSGSRSRTEMSSEMEQDQGSRHFSPEVFTFSDRVRADKTPGANGLDPTESDADDAGTADKPMHRPAARSKTKLAQHVCKVEPEDSKRSSLRLKKLLSRRRCRSLEPNCVVLDVVDLTKDGTKVRHLRHAGLRGNAKKLCSCCVSTEEQLKRELDKNVATSKKTSTTKPHVKGGVFKKR